MNSRLSHISDYAILDYEFFLYFFLALFLGPLIVVYDFLRTSLGFNKS